MSSKRSDIDLAAISPRFARLHIRERYEALGLANMTLRAPIQAIGYAPTQWRTAERGSFIEEIPQTGRVIYRGNMRERNGKSKATARRK